MKDIATKVNGVSTYSAAEFNPNMTELENAVTKSGQILDPTGTNLDQLSEAMGRYGAGGGDYYTDSGVNNAYVLTGPLTFIQSKAYFDGMHIVFVANALNTTAATINVNTIGTVNLKDDSGNTIGLNFITVGATISARYNALAGEFRITSTGRSIPFGFIGLFVGAIADIPAGWALCDGTLGTPDLRNNFIRGAGSTFAPNQTGGSETSGGHILSIAELPPHSFTYDKSNGVKGTGDDNGPLVMLNTTSPVATNTIGSGSSHAHPNSVPPFYALAFIMKL